MGDTTGSPLSGPPPKEIPLPLAPLVRVLAQVHFPILLVIREEKDLSSFQESIRDVYPILTRDTVQSANIEMSPHGPSVQTTTAVIFRFTDESGNWRVSLAPDFVALETKKYISRKDFLKHLRFILESVAEVYNPKITTRLGLRYVDQLKDEAFLRAGTLIKTEAMGLAACVDSERVNRAATEINLKADEGDLNIRWIKLKANSTYDPDAVEPISADSWVLDLDISTRARHSFDAGRLDEVFESFAERVYSMFRYMITDEFIDYYGGKE